jgi:putative drug exporter of the RND superfamily
VDDRLSALPLPRDHAKAMYKLLGSWISRHWLLTIVGWAALAGGVRWLAPSWDSVTHDGDLAYMPDEMPSVRGEQLLRQAFPENLSKSQIVLVCARPEGPLTSDDLRVLERLAKRFAADDELPINTVWTPWTEVIGKKLISRDRRAALAVLLLSNEFMAVDNIRVLGRVERIASEVRESSATPEGLRLEISGSAAIGGDMLTSAQESIQNTELATIVLVVVILLLVYRAPLLISIPMVTIGVSILVALGLVAALTQANQLSALAWLDFKVFKTTKIFVVVILFGSGTDFCLFLIARYKEELRHGLDHAAAVAGAVAAVGDALVGSAMTTILGLGTMVFAAFGKYRNSGPALALCLAVTLAACLTLAPALLRAIGPLVFWPFHGTGRRDAAGEADAATTSGFWHLVSQAIVRWPGWILTLSCLALAPLAYRGLSVGISYDLTEELRADRASVIGTHLLREYFPAGDTGPITVLAEQAGANFDSLEGDRMVSQVTKLLYDLPGVANVRSISEPLGDRPGAFNLFSPAGRRKLAVKKHPRTKAIYLAQAPGYAGSVTRLDVVTRHDPFSLQSMELLDEIDRRLQTLAADEESPWFGTDFVYAGTTAGVRDLKAVTQSDQTLIQRLVVIAVLAVLIVILRRPLICAYLILTVLFSYLVTMGATQLLFAYLYQPFSGLDWKVPLFLFVILTAIGEDYNIYLMTRVMEEQRRLGLVEGLRVAVVRTGGIITSCGVIMAGTFVSMMFGTLRGILELGFALSLGIVLDTLVVRPVLVPAFLTILYRRRERLAESGTGATIGSQPRGEWHRLPS